MIVKQFFVKYELFINIFSQLQKAILLAQAKCQVVYRHKKNKKNDMKFYENKDIDRIVLRKFMVVNMIYMV